MSVIFLTDHNENIYDIIPPPPAKIIKPPIFISKYTENIRENFKKNKELKKTKHFHATMGLETYISTDPKDFLKRQVKETPEKPLKKEKTELKLQVPKHDGWVKTKHKCEDMIKKNIEYVKGLTPPEVQPKYVDTRNGDKHVFETSGLKLMHVNNINESFGVPPKYLLKRMRASERAKMKEKDKEDRELLPKCRYLTRQERQDLLDGLKKNWEEMQKEFQLLPMITDTIPKVNKKVKLEKNLLDLEKDIRLIEKHPYIYLVDEEGSIMTDNS